MATLHEFLVNVGKDPVLLMTWFRDANPDALLEDSGLTEQHKNLLREGDLDGIRDALAEEAGKTHPAPAWVVGGRPWVLIKT